MKRVPLILKLLLPLIAGVVLAFYTNFYPDLVLLLSLLIGLILMQFPFLINHEWGKRLFASLLFSFFFLLGAHLAGIQTNRFHSHYFYKLESDWETIYQVEVIEEPEEKDNSVKCFVSVRAVDGVKSMGNSLLYFEKSERSQQLKYGDLICLNTRFNVVRPNGNPKEFDYSRYLRIHDVVHQGYVKDANWTKIGQNGHAFFEWVFGVRSYLDDVLKKSGLSNENLMVARALILGKKESLDRETLRTYSSAGAMHVLAVSGLHVGIVMLLFSFVLKPIKRLPNGKLYFLVLVIAGIWFYALITGLSSSVLRASVMFSFVIVGKELERETSIYQSIMVSAFLLILAEPFVVFQVGFQLSYLAVLGIVFLQPKIYNLFYFRNIIVDKIWQISSVSLAAQLATFPLGLYYFHQFPNFFMVSNLIVIPLAFAILLVGIIYFLVVWIPGIELLFFTLFNALLSILNYGVKWVESLPHSIYWGVSIHWFEVFWLYLILLLAACAFMLRKSKLVVISLILVVGLLVFNVAEKHYLASKSTLVIYNVNKSIAMDIFEGNQNSFIADQALVRDEDKLLFHVKHNWFYRTGQESPDTTHIYRSSKNLLRFGANELLILDGEIEQNRLPKTNFVYLHNTTFVPKVLLEDWKNRNVKVIIGAGVKYNVRKFLGKQLLQEQIYDLENEGALVLNF